MAAKKTVAEAPKLGAFVTVTATEKAKYLKKGKEYEMTIEMAAKLLKSKKVTLKS
jgi:hypothetical protein